MASEKTFYISVVSCFCPDCLAGAAQMIGLGIVERVGVTFHSILFHFCF